MKRSLLLATLLLFSAASEVQEISVGITVAAREQLSTLWANWDDGCPIHCACLYGTTEPPIVQVVTAGWELSECGGDRLLGGVWFGQGRATPDELDWMACGLQSLYGWEVAGVLVSEDVLAMGVCVKDPHSARWRNSSEET